MTIFIEYYKAIIIINSSECNFLYSINYVITFSCIMYITSIPRMSLLGDKNGTYVYHVRGEDLISNPLRNKEDSF